MRIIIIVLFIPIFFLHAQTFNDWETHSYMNDVKDIICYDNNIWAATTGGAYKFNINDSTFQKYTNVDGLESLDLSAVTVDNYSNIIFGSADGSISVFNPQFSLWKSLTDIEGETITDLLISGDTLWVSSNTGLGVFLYNNSEYEFRDFYNSFPVVPSSSKKIRVFDNKIFYATNEGLLYAPSNFIKTNLKSADNWNVYTTTEILPNNDVRTLEIINDTLYIGTANGATRLAKDGWNGSVFGWNSGALTHFSSINDTLFCFRYTDYYKYYDGLWSRISGIENTIQTVDKDKNDEIWLGIKINGLRKLKWNSSFLIDGPGSNYVGLIEKDNTGNLWMTSGRFKLPHREGFYKYDFHQWTNYKFSGNKWIYKNQSVSVFEDLDKNLWIGNWNGGLTAITDTGLFFIHPWADSGSVTISTIKESQIIDLKPISEKWRSCLSQSKELIELMVIPYFTEDNNGNLYLANYIANDLNFITVIPRSQNGLELSDCEKWLHFGINIGMNPNDERISSLEFDDFGRLWAGNEERGLLVINFNETLNDPSDDQIFRVGVDDNLFSNTVLCLKKDHDGVMWIGTAAGLNSYDGQNFYKHIGETGPIENKINYIFVDDFNNKWLATDGGLSILEGDKSPWEESAWKHYTTENSGLAHEIVSSVFVDSKKGEAYIGTDGGLSIFSGAYSEIKQNFDNLSGGPNPYFLGDNSVNFVVTNLMVNSTVKILNINGKLIRVLSEENDNVEGSRVTWDGRDSNNNLVASGIYIYLVYSEDGVVSKGKLSVIRK